jgi:hypothetical protein
MRREGTAEAMLPILYPVVPCRTRGRHSLAFHDARQAEPAEARVLDRVRAAARLRHYSPRTEAAHVASPNDVRTTMIYTHVLNQGPASVASPADRGLDP